MYDPPVSTIEIKDPNDQTEISYIRVLFWVWLLISLTYMSFRFHGDYRSLATLPLRIPASKPQLIIEGLKAMYETGLVMLPCVALSFPTGHKVGYSIRKSFLAGLKWNVLMSLSTGFVTGAWFIILDATSFLFLTRSKNSSRDYLPIFIAISVIIFVFSFLLNLLISTAFYLTKKEPLHPADA